MKRRKNLILIVGAVLVLCLIAVGIFTLTANSAEKKLAEQLELGQKYLDELDYEQAIVAYKAAIEINPKCEEAYLALAEVYVAIGDYESAIDILNQGIEQTESEALAAYLQEVERMRDGASGTGHGTEETQREDMENADDQSNGLREDVIHNDDGSYYVNTYDGNGKLIKRTWYNVDGSVRFVVEYEYGSNGKCIKEIWYNADGGVDYVDEFDNNGNGIRRTWYNADGSVDLVFEYEYDSNGNCTKRTDYNADGSMSGVFVYEYDSDRNRIKNTGYYPDGSVASVEEYDSNGNCIKGVAYFPDGSVSSVEEYDSNGNRIKWTMYNIDGSVSFVEEYENNVVDN